MTPLGAQGKQEEAESLLLQAIRIQENALGADHPLLAISLYHRGQVLLAQVMSCSVSRKNLGCDFSADYGLTAMLC